MKCGACGHDDENAREEDGFVRVEFSPGRHVTASFPQHEAPSVVEPVGMWACPKCGVLRVESWRIKGVGA